MTPWARDADRVEETAALADGASGTVVGAYADVADPATVTTLAQSVREQHGVPTVLVNSADRHLAKPAMDVTPEEWDAVMGTQLRGTFFSCQAFGRQMAEVGYGKIVNLGSTWAVAVGLGRRGVYGTAKAGVHHLTSCLAVEWAPLGRLAEPADVVGAALFLSSRASDFVTGETIFVDGGWRRAT